MPPATSFNLSVTPDWVTSAIKSFTSIFLLEVNVSITLGIIGTMALTMAGDKPNFLAISELNNLPAKSVTGLAAADERPVNSSISWSIPPSFKAVSLILPKIESDTPPTTCSFKLSGSDTLPKISPAFSLIKSVINDRMFNGYGLSDSFHFVGIQRNALTKKLCTGFGDEIIFFVT